MAHGRLGVASPSVNTPVIVYTVPVNCLYADININVLNPGVTDMITNIAIAVGDAALSNEYIEKGAIVAANGGVLERVGIRCSPGERIIVSNNQANSVIRVYGSVVSAK